MDLLPKWDCYTMGYAPDGRGRFVHPHIQDRVYTPAGDGRGVVLVGGRAAGAWQARFSGRVMRVRLGMFERPGAGLERAVEDGFGEISVLLGARDLAFS
ncbi:MAG: winged helix DNA-binding domain-containing protein [Actinomycetota bacterium]|nr:winged helix DNA-binding domain-containing protein [Actinomycetota bacterium]